MSDNDKTDAEKMVDKIKVMSDKELEQLIAFFPSYSMVAALELESRRKK